MEKSLQSTKSRTIRYKDFSSKWYKHWSKVLKQQEGISPNQLVHNKLWQNAIIMNVLAEKGYLKKGNKALGFGVGIERVPSALASLGLKVTATDQNFEDGKKAGWDNGQLAHSQKDLNMYNICPEPIFQSNVIYKNCDMNNIKPSLHNNYDIVWSNCALGHLGSIENGLKFIKESVKCLKPGGVAVHTTEINVLSDNKTLDSGGTVIFRLKDITDLFFDLRNEGLICSPLEMDFGKDLPDKEVGFHPYKSENLLKILVGGHVLSQIVLIIQKPLVIKPKRTNRARKEIETRRNKLKTKLFISKNRKLSIYLKNQEQVSLNGPRPTKKIHELILKPGDTGTVRVKIKNYGQQTYYDQGHYYHTNYPLVVVGADPVNRNSELSTDNWTGKSRPAMYFDVANSFETWGALKPGESCFVDLEFKAPKKTGVYKEVFCLALEGLGATEKSDFSVVVRVKSKI